MNTFDHWVKQDLGIKYYGRYVDDFVLVHTDKEYLKSLIAPIRNYLEGSLNLELHPNKIYRLGGGIIFTYLVELLNLY